MTFIKTLILVGIVCAAALWSGLVLALVERLDATSLGGWGNFLTGIGTMGLFLVTFIGSIFLPSKIEEKRLDFARREQHRKLRFEVARDTFVAFNKAYLSLKRIRSPMISYAKEDEKKYSGISGSARFKLEVIQKEATYWQRLDEMEPLFRALFEDTQPFNDFRKAVFDVHRSASTLAYEDFTLSDEEDKKFSQKCKDNLWESYGRTDPISPAVDAAFDRIKEICIPEIRQDPKTGN